MVQPLRSTAGEPARSARSRDPHAGRVAGTARRVKSPAMPRMSHITALYLITGVCGLVDAACFLAMGGVFAEIITGNLLFLCFFIGTGQPIFAHAKYILVI